MQGVPVLNDPDFLRIVAATPLVSIDLILRNARDEILLGRRTNRPAQGRWFVPGGRIRKDERVPEALRRISRREVGLELREAKLLGVFDHLYPDNFAGAPGISTHYVVLGMEARWPEDVAPIADAQHEALKWWGEDELLASPDVHENTKAYFRPA